MSNANRIVRRAIARAAARKARTPRKPRTLFAGERADGSRFYHLGFDERPVALPRFSAFRPRSYTKPEDRAARDHKRVERGVNRFAPSMLPVHFYGSPTPSPGTLNLRSTSECVEAAARSEWR